MPTGENGRRWRKRIGGGALALALALPGLVFGAAPPVASEEWPGTILDLIAMVNGADWRRGQKVEKVEYRGNHHMSNEELEGITAIRAGMPFESFDNTRACARIVAIYNAEGRPFASCTLLKGASPDDTEVIFQITEGPKVKVTDIRFTGNTFVSSGVLKTHINSSRIFLGVFHLIGGTYNAQMVESDTNEFLKYYRSFGFHAVRVARELQYTPDGREVVVIFHIQEGVRYIVKDRPMVQGVRCMPHESLEAICKVNAGEYYDQHKIDADIARLEAWLGHDGRNVKAQAIPVYSKDVPGVVALRYEVEEMEPARVGEIRVIGNERSSENFTGRGALHVPQQD